MVRRFDSALPAHDWHPVQSHLQNDLLCRWHFSLNPGLAQALHGALPLNASHACIANAINQDVPCDKLVCYLIKTHIMPSEGRGGSPVGTPTRQCGNKKFLLVSVSDPHLGQPTRCVLRCGGTAGHGPRARGECTGFPRG